MLVWISAHDPEWEYVVLEQSLGKNGRPRHEDMVDPLRLRPFDILLYSWFSGSLQTRVTKILVDSQGDVRFECPTTGPWSYFGSLSVSDAEVDVLVSMVADFGPLLKNTSSMDGGASSSIRFWRSGAIQVSELPFGGPTPWKKAVPEHLRPDVEILERWKDRVFGSLSVRRFVRRRS